MRVTSPVESMSLLCTAQMTLRSAVFASASCVEWAVASGLELNGTPPNVWCRHRVAGKTATVAALAAAKKAGLALGYHVMQGVAASGLCRSYAGCLKSSMLCYRRACATTLL
jgi:hypothetical protein